MKTDARIRYTRHRIKEVFFQLLSEKKLSQITVTEICDLAEINRSTFYHHYLDVQDLFQKMEEEVLKDTRSQWQKLYPRNTVEAMEAILRKIADTSSDTVFYLFREDPAFSFLITEIICEDTCANFMENAALPKQEKKMLNRFIVNGSGSVVRNWLVSENKQSAHDVAVFLFRLIEKITH